MTITRNYKFTPRISRGTTCGPPTALHRRNHRNTAKSGGGKVNNVEEEEKGRMLREGVSVRKLGAALWRMQAEVAAEEDSGQKRWREQEEDNGDGGGDRLGFKAGIGRGGEQLFCHHRIRDCGVEAADPIRSPCSVNGPVNGYYCESTFQYANHAMEGATKWDPVSLKPSDDSSGDTKLLDQKADATMISALETELEQARTRIEELELERRSSKTKVEHFVKKVSEERAAWRNREHDKVGAVIADIKVDLNRERKNQQRLENVNSKLVNELGEVKLSAKRHMQEYEKERKTREIIEEVCDELAKEIGEDKAEVNSLEKECLKIREEVNDERKMLQMAEVWREERVQTKLVDAKVALDQKYSQVNYLVEKLEIFLTSKGVVLVANELKKAEMFQRAASSMTIKDIKEFTHEPSNSDDIFAVVEEMAMAESIEREIEVEPCVEYSLPSHASKAQSVTPERNSHSKDIHRLSNMYSYPSGDMDDDGSEWETVSRGKDHGSSYSLEGSIMSVNRMCRNSNVSGSCTEWEEQVGDETPITEISEVCSVPSKQSKKVTPISRLWRSGLNNGDNYKTISVDGGHGRLSNEAMYSPDHGLGEGGGFSPNVGEWCSPESGNPHINRETKGCIEWPRGAQKSSLKDKLLEARMESQKIQLRQVLKQKS